MYIKSTIMKKRRKILRLAPSFYRTTDVGTSAERYTASIKPGGTAGQRTTAAKLTAKQCTASIELGKILRLAPSFYFYFLYTTPVRVNRVSFINELRQEPKLNGGRLRKSIRQLTDSSISQTAYQRTFYIFNATL